MIERTLSIIKPDGIRRNLQDEILKMIKQNGLEIIKQKTMQLTHEQAEKFYIAHQNRPFFYDLCTFMSSGPISVQILSGENAIAVYRNLMGATDPEKAEKNTLRKKFGINIDQNTVHGSDSIEAAEYEIACLFN